MSTHREDGFVLVTVIWFVALLALACTIIWGWVSDSLQRAAALNDRIDAERTMISATDQLVFLVTSSYFTDNSLVPMNAMSGATVNPLGFAPPKDVTPVYIDSRPYRFGAGIVELQDAKGLYNVAHIDNYSFLHLLEHFGISSQQGAGLIDKLADYQAANTTVQHLNGANRDAYVSAGRPPPRNAPLITPWEMYRVMDWDGYSALWTGASSLPDLTVVTPDTQGFNPNTAPVALLRSLPGMSDDAIDKVLQYRDAMPIASLVQLQSLTGLTIPIDPTDISAAPANSMRMEIAFPTSPLTRVVELNLPPQAIAPYRIDYAVDVPQEAAIGTALAATDLPAFPASGPVP